MKTLEGGGQTAALEHREGRRRDRRTPYRLTAGVLLFFAVACGSTAPAPQPQTVPQTEHGVASWYGQEFAGRTTANGEIFDPLLFTAAHRSLPFGTIVDVRNARTNQSVRVRINDRGPYIGNRTIDLSYAAAQQISLIEPGSGEIDLTIVRLGKGEREPPAPFSVTIGNETPAPPVAATAPPTAITPVPAPAPQPVVVDRVQVENRKQVSPSGKSVDIVPLPQPAAPTSVAARQTPPPAPAPAPAPVPVPAPVPPPAPAPAPPTVKVQPQPVAPAPQPQPATSPTGRYVVQVGAFSQEANAKALQDRLTRIGQTSHIDHGSLYFVRLGPFATREGAVQMRSKLEAAGISAIVITP